MTVKHRSHGFFFDMTEKQWAKFFVRHYTQKINKIQIKMICLLNKVHT